MKSEAEAPKKRTKRDATDNYASNPISVETILKDGEKVTPEMSNPNGASVKSQEIPDSSYKKVEDTTKYTFEVINLTRFNKNYNVNYYIRAYKNYDNSKNATVELVDKTTNKVIETINIAQGGAKQSFTKTTEASNKDMTLTISSVEGASATKEKLPFLHIEWDINPTILSYAEMSGNTQDEKEKKAKYTKVMNTRSMNDIFNAVEPTYNGREITHSDVIIPSVLGKTTYYRVVDKANQTYKSDKTDTSVQDYVPNGKETDLASYTLKTMEGQNFTASGVRQFEGYRLYQSAAADSLSGYVSRPYVVGTKFLDANANGIKRIKEVVKEDGTVGIRVYVLDPRQQEKRSDGTLETDGYILMAETGEIPPGGKNTVSLPDKEVQTIAFTDKNGVAHPNGITVKGHTSTGHLGGPDNYFIPFLGDKIGHNSQNDQLVNGVQNNGAIGTNVFLRNSLAPYKPTVYYYVKNEPAEVELGVTKVLNNRKLKENEFTFNIKNADDKTPALNQDKTNATDGTVKFDKISFYKAGTYTYTITEKVGTDTDVDYDAMTVTAVVTVVEKDGKLTVEKPKYSYANDANSNGKFDNYYVAPKELDFSVEFTKVLDGRPLKDREFSFTMKDKDGTIIANGTNDTTGKITFTFVDGKKPMYKKADAGKTFTYTVEEVQKVDDKETGYDPMKAEVTVTVSKDESHVLTVVTTPPKDTEFNNTAKPPKPKFQPEKYVADREKFDITGEKLLDDDKELTDKYGDTNKDPYTDKTDNNEAENLNTKTLKRGQKIVYQVWLDTNKFEAAHKIQQVGITDEYDSAYLTVEKTGIKVYDSKTGNDVTDLFDITVENGKITATSKESLIKDNVLDLTQFSFGRYYKFDIVATIKADTPDGVDIENTAKQTVH
ncbi:Spy0128 family protein [Gemella sp. Musashino-2025]